MSDFDKKKATKPSAGAAGFQKDDFAEEFPPDSASVVADMLSNHRRNEKMQATAATVAKGSTCHVQRAADKLDHTAVDPRLVEHEDELAAWSATATSTTFTESPSNIQLQNNNNAAPGAFLISHAGCVVTQKTLTESRRAVVVDEELKQAEEEEVEPLLPRTLDVEPGDHDHGQNHEQGDYFIAEASMVHQEDIAIAEIRNKQQSYKRNIYRAIFIGTILFACILVGVVVGLLARPTGSVNSSPAPTGTAAPPTTLAPTDAFEVEATLAPSRSNLASEQVACDFIAQTSLSEYLLQRTVMETNGLTIPSEIGLLTKLTYLSLEDTGLTGTIPESVERLTELRHLTFRFNNALMGSIPSSIGNLVQLTKLDVGLTGLQGTIPSSIGRLSQLQVLDLYYNEFSGGIPMSLGEMTQLTHVSFAANSLSGSIPNIFGNLTQLTYLDFGYNQLDGSVPSSFAALTMLTLLGMYVNRFTGSIPPFIGNLTEMKQLHWDNCQFTGVIPSSIAFLTQLSGLNFGGNLITGSIPSSVAALTKLTYLSLNSNQLTGSIPASLCSVITEIVVICGAVKCDCCQGRNSSNALYDCYKL